ncbi:hypothetical protein [Thiohalocapsa marina]|uniref:hypothetical protein n=1 Tax=Thiohalocapsa marina TaxID=424902 RepID=UPI0036D84E44
MIKLAIKLVLLLLAAISAGVLWQQNQLLVLALSRIDPIPETRAMIAEERYAEAADYLGFFLEYDYVSSNPEAVALFEQIDETRSAWGYQLDKLGEGLFSGTSDETIGQVASVGTDFFVIGDLRDLAKQGVNLAKGDEVDDVLVALASIGVVASAAQALSGVGTVASGGVAAPAAAGTTAAKSSLIALKTARKLGKLPPWLGKAIIQAGKRAKQSKSLGAFTGLLGDVGTLAKTPGGFRLLGQAQDAAALSRYARFAETFGAQSATLYRIGGDAVVATAQHAGTYGKQTVKLAATYGQGGLRALDKVGAIKFTKFASRGSKMAYKGDLLQLIAKVLLMLPRWVLYALIGLGALVWLPIKPIARLFRRVDKPASAPVEKTKVVSPA